MLAEHAGMGGRRAGPSAGKMIVGLGRRPYTALPWVFPSLRSVLSCFTVLLLPPVPVTQARLSCAVVLSAADDGRVVQ
jgi:hypothetical protein